jgi:PAS domain S-box-containing protein
MKKLIEKLNVGKRLTLVIGIGVIVAVSLTALSLYGLSKTNASFQTVYLDRLVPLADLNAINLNQMDINQDIGSVQKSVYVSSLGGKSILLMDSNVAEAAAAEVQKIIIENEKLWKGYMATYLTPEEKVLAATFEKSYNRYIEEGVKPAIAALRMHNLEAVKKHYGKTLELDLVADDDMQKLKQLQLDVAKVEFDNSLESFKSLRLISSVSLTIAVAILFWLGVLVSRSIVNPLKKSIEIFKQIENGEFKTPINANGNDELSQVLNELAGMRTNLAENIAKQEQIAEQVKDQAIAFQSQLNAISKSTGMLVMDPEGNVLDTNDLFLNSFGYAKDELIGKNHEIFVQHEGVDKKQNDEIWAKLKLGMSASAQIKRFSKEGKEIWLDVTYNPILSADGTNKVLKVVNYYRDVTEQKIKDIDVEGQLNAIGRSQGVIELDLEGYIIKVNKTYSDMLGYQEKELLDQHVSMLLEPTFANSHAYKDLWNKLVNGAVDSGQYKRIGKGGKEVWIQASYNPIKNEDGKIIKIVNYTIDITEEKLTASDNMSQIAAINKIQGVIEFDLAGKIIAVNENFAAVTGYSKEEILGNHHSMFLDAAYKASAEYKKFWEDLVNGNANEGRFRRLGKGGKEIWLQAFYSPILDLNGNPYKVIKLATEITEQYKAAHALEVAVQESQSVIEGAKAGDLTSRVSLEGKTGAIASLCDGINALMDKMTEVITQVREAGETINTAANEIATGNNDLSSRTEQQASSLEETASSMEELASTVKQNAENAKQANQLASAASGVAVKGGEVVGNVVTTMADINSSARKIEDIISVIDGIAFQTNILALNAAVEAARAGEQGRGFAVVAGEVRNLAQRSASAAKEIKELISDSVGKVQEGTKLVEDAGSTMHEIVSSVQRVTDIMGEISAASSEQSAGIDQVNNAITSMDEVTQQNAALVEEAAAAAESLVEQAASLMDTVGAFRLAGGGNAYANQLSSRSTKPAESVERRAINSPMRSSAPATKSTTKSQSKPASNVIAKSGTDDGEWEEF